MIKYLAILTPSTPSVLNFDQLHIVTSARRRWLLDQVLSFSALMLHRDRIWYIDQGDSNDYIVDLTTEEAMVYELDHGSSLIAKEKLVAKLFIQDTNELFKIIEDQNKLISQLEKHVALVQSQLDEVLRYRKYKN
jgi:hypothetical protein